MPVELETSRIQDALDDAAGAISGRTCLGPLDERLVGHVGIRLLVGAAQVDIETKIYSSPSYHGFKSMGPGAFNMALIGSTCTGLPC